MNQPARLVIAATLALGACGDDVAGPGEPIDPSAAATFRGYAAIQDDLYAKLIADGTPFELYRYLGPTGAELSKLVGRPDGFGVQYDVRNARPNAMNVLVWRMMLRPLANDLVATCPGSALSPAIEPRITIGQHAAPIVDALCAWPGASDQALTDAWDLVVGELAPAASRAAFVRYARNADLQSRRADDALPDVWLGALLHPAFLLEQ